MNDRPASTTRATLRRLTAALLVVTATMGIATTSALFGVYRTAQTVRADTVPALVGVADARGALIIAHEAVIHSFESDEVHLTGAGGRHQDYIAAASRSLTLVAEDNVAGEDGSQKIQLVEGLLLAYLGLIQQADAHYRRDGGAVLGRTYLWHAWQLLDREILPALTELRQVQQAAFDRQRSAEVLAVPAAVVAAPFLGLTVLLLVGQGYLRRRFRRRFNVPLVAATGLLLLLATVATISVLAVQQRLDAADESLDRTRDAWEQNAPTETGQRALLRLLECDPPAEEGDEGERSGPAQRCGPTVQRAHEDLYRSLTTDGAGADGSDRRPAREPSLASRSAEQDRLTWEAVQWSLMWLAAPLVAVAIGALILAGFGPRLKEYRYR